MRLTAENVTCMRGERTVLSGVSFSIAEGEGLLLRGPNGAGKTTLLRTIAGFMTPAKGRVCVEGAKGRELGELCHYVGHLNGIKSRFTVLENLCFLDEFLGNRPVAKKDVECAIETFGLGELRNIPAGLLSAGQKRRLSLARLLLAKRPLWLLDEPSVSLDAASQELLARQVHAHAAAGGLVIASSHVPLGIDFTQVLELRAGRARLTGGGA